MKIYGNLIRAAAMGALLCGLALQASAQLSGTTLLPAAATVVTPTTTVYTEDYEGTAFTWGSNSWGTNPSFVVEKNSLAANASQGNGSAHFKIYNPDVNFVLNSFTFDKGVRYKVEAKIKSDSAATVELLIRAGTPYYPYAYRQVKTTTTWQTVTIEGIPNEQSLLYLYSSTGPNIYLDELKITKIQQDELLPVDKTSVIPDTMFGLHVNKLGVHNSWPAVGQKIIRLHDTGTHWCDLEPREEEWDFTRLDLYVNYAQSHGPTPLIYNMGQSPQYASTEKTKPGFYCGGQGGSAAPDMAAWSKYVNKLGNRYKGKIKYWEIWNEWDIDKNYSGSVAAMVQMAQIARDNLKAIDPTNVIVAPSITARLGTQYMDQFLRAGGGAYVDIMNLHIYEAGPIEEIAGAISNVKAIMNLNSVGNKPLWNTEGGFECDPVAQPGCVSATTLGASALAAPIRNLLIMWAKGVSNFNYYHWEGGSPTGALVYGTWQTSTAAGCSYPNYDPNCPTPLGKNYAQAVSWLKSSKLTDAYTTQGVNGKIYIFKMLGADGKFKAIIWTTGGNEVVRFTKEAPSFGGSTWDKLGYTAPLNGIGTKTAIPTALLDWAWYKYVTVSVTPQLLTIN